MDALTTCEMGCAPAYYISGSRKENTDGLLKCDAGGFVTGDIECARKTCTIDNIQGFFDDPHAVAGTCNVRGGKDSNSVHMFANSYCKLECAPGYHAVPYGSDSEYGLLHCKGGTGLHNPSGVLTGGIRCEMKSCVVGDIEKSFGHRVVPGTCGTTAPGTRHRRIPVAPSDAVVCDFHGDSEKAENSSAASFDYIEMDDTTSCKKKLGNHTLGW